MAKLMTLCGVFILAFIIVITMSLTYLMTYSHRLKICQIDPCLIKLSTGFVKGIEEKTVINEKNYLAFKGIPYAEPPIGQLRFKDPLPGKSWTGVVDGSGARDCPQIHHHAQNYTGNEDCLFINVYTPQLPNEMYSNLLPVMVWIHGGAFQLGSSDSDIYGPDFLLEEDVIVVTFNYRLNVLGFLSLGNTDVPGNAGLKDQNMALKWVHNNIKYFCGDKSKVTLFGDSAGSASVHYHTLIPQSSGLFNNVIMQSGTVLNPWAFNNDPVPCAIQLANTLGLNSSNTDEIFSFLKEQTTEILVNSQESFICKGKKRGLKFPFVPSKEVSGTGLNFLIENPITILESQQFSQVPYIIGMVNKEGLMVLTDEMQTSPDVLESITKNQNSLLPEDLSSNSDEDDDDGSIVKKVNKFYFDNYPVSWENITKFVDLVTDLQFTIGIEWTLYYLTQMMDVPPIFVYLFTYEGRLGHTKNKLKMSVKDLPPGVAHADDNGYLFHRTDVNKKLLVSKDSPEINTVRRICSLWTNFAKYSDPNENSFDIVWKKYFYQNRQYLDIGETLKTVQSRLFENRTAFWSDIYNIFSTSV